MYPTQAGQLSDLGNPDVLLLGTWKIPLMLSNQRETRVLPMYREITTPTSAIRNGSKQLGFGVVRRSQAAPIPRHAITKLAANEDDGSCTYPEAGLDCSGAPLESCTLFFSEYAEGSSNNKYLEIFNPGLTEVSLATMALAHTVNTRHAGDLRDLGGISRKFDGSCRQCVPNRTHLCSGIAEFGRLYLRQPFQRR